MMDTVYHAGRLIPIGDHKLYIEEHGIGVRCIVLKAGAGETSATWQPILATLAQHSHVVAYDRAGLGKSIPPCMLPKAFPFLLTFVGIGKP
jgi:pimeloyl-ACP methyl ester carboxylesterase